MKQNTVQLTIRGVPEDVVKVLRKRARLSGQSFNKTIVTELSKNTLPKRDAFEELRGSGLEDSVLEALADQRKPDPKLWQ